MFSIYLKIPSENASLKLFFPCPLLMVCDTAVRVTLGILKYVFTFCIFNISFSVKVITFDTAQ